MNIVMTVNDLLAWAWSETQMADGLELMLDELPQDIRPSLEKQIKEHRRRSRWLDQQVEIHLDRAERESANE